MNAEHGLNATHDGLGRNAETPTNRWRTLVRAAVASLGLCIAPTAGLGTSGCALSCTEVGCSGTGVSVETLVACSAAEAGELAVSLCRNGACYEGTFTGSALPDTPGGEVDIPLSETDDFLPLVAEVRAHLMLVESGTYEVRVDFEPREGDLRDGDVYTVSVHNAAGTLVTGIAAAVPVREEFPNGPECGPRCLVTDIVQAPEGACAP